MISDRRCSEICSGGDSVRSRLFSYLVGLEERLALGKITDGPHLEEDVNTPNILKPAVGTSLVSVKVSILMDEDPSKNIPDRELAGWLNQRVLLVSPSGSFGRYTHNGSDPYRFFSLPYEEKKEDISVNFLLSMNNYGVYIMSQKGCPGSRVKGSLVPINVLGCFLVSLFGGIDFSDAYSSDPRSSDLNMKQLDDCIPVPRGNIVLYMKKRGGEGENAHKNKSGGGGGDDGDQKKKIRDLLDAVNELTEICCDLEGLLRRDTKKVTPLAPITHILDELYEKYPPGTDINVKNSMKLIMCHILRWKDSPHKHLFTRKTMLNLYMILYSVSLRRHVDVKEEAKIDEYRRTCKIDVNEGNYSVKRWIPTETEWNGYISKYINERFIERQGGTITSS